MNMEGEVLFNIVTRNRTS